MRLIFNGLVLLLIISQASGQKGDQLRSPIINVKIALAKDTFGVNEDLELTMILENQTKETQIVWFDRPKSSTGGPAMTSVSILEQRSNRSVLKYQNKGILSSQAYSEATLRPFLYNLKPGQTVSGKFSLYDMVVVNTGNKKFNKGTYVMRIFYYNNLSNKIIFTIK